MEVCGGHTHSIFRYGIEGMLPTPIELVHGPGCPVCVLPMGRVDDCVAIAEQPEVIFTTFGDAMRVPGSRKSLLQAKADGADVRMVYSPMDALALARKNPDREVVFFGLGFETTMPSTALTDAAGRARRHREFLGLLQSHHHRADHQGDPRQPRSAARRLPRARPRLDGDRHRALRVHRRATIAKPLVVAGFEPLDMLQSIWMVLKQINEGRAEIENQYARVVPDGGNAPALSAVSRGLRAARVLRMARPRLDRSFRRPHPRRLRPLRRRAQIRRAQRHGSPIPKSCQCGEVLKGVIKPWQCKVFGTACTPETPLGALMVSSEGACAAYYQYGGIQAPRRGRRMNVAAPVRARPLGQVHVPTVTLAHGGGGKAMKDLIDDVFVARLRQSHARPARGSGAARSRRDLARRGDRLAFTTDSFVVDPLFFPGGDIGKLAVCGTVNDLAVGGAVPLYLSCAVIIEEGVTSTCCGASPARWPRRRGGRRADRHRRHQGRAQGRLRQAVHHHDRHRRDPRRRRSRRASRRAGDAVLVNGLLGDHGAAILGARGDMALETPIESDCAPLQASSQALLAAAPGHALHARRHARRRRDGAQRDRRGLAASPSRSTRRATPIRDEVKAFCEILGLDPLYLANEGKIVAVVPADEAEAALAAMRAHPLGPRRGDHRPGHRRRARPRDHAHPFGGQRIVDMLVGEQLPRIC